jgi:nucleotide-binding universal stress UspA family protein
MMFMRSNFLVTLTIKKILVPMDGSRQSRKALTHAIEIAKKFKSKIYLITVVDTSNFPPGMLLALLKKDTKFEKSIGEFVIATKSIARRDLLADVAICKSKGVVNSYYDVVAGRPVEAILKYEYGLHPDLIVMGSQGLQGLRQMKFLGSVSRKVSELAKCPVMIVR